MAFRPSRRGLFAMLLLLAACHEEMRENIRTRLEPKRDFAVLMPQVVGCWEMIPGRWLHDPDTTAGGMSTASAPERFRLDSIRVTSIPFGTLDTAARLFRAEALGDTALSWRYRYWSQVDGRARVHITSGDIGISLGASPASHDTLALTVTASTDVGPRFQASRPGLAKRIACPAE